MYVQTPSYEVVQNYIKHGLPEDHWSFDSANSSRKRKLATWHDTLTGEYNDFPPYALFSARFMDGLTSSMYFQDREFNDAYACAGCRSKNCTWWHEKFVQHAGVVFSYYVNKQRSASSSSAKKQKTSGSSSGSGSGSSSSSSSSSSISDSTHPAFVDSLGNHGFYMFDHNTYSKSPLQSGHLVGEYSDAENRSRFLKFCIDKIEGYQSQSLMREKLFCVLDVDAHKLPKTKQQTKKGEDKEMQQKWFHILQSIINAFSCNTFWLGFKFYGEEDLAWLFKELVPRVKQTLNHLHSEKFFEAKEGSEALILILLRMKEIEEEFDGIKEFCSRKNIFGAIIKKYLPIADAGYKMSHENTAELKQLTLATLAFQTEEEEDEDEP